MWCREVGGIAVHSPSTKPSSKGPGPTGQEALEPGEAEAALSAQQEAGQDPGKTGSEDDDDHAERAWLGGRAGIHGAAPIPTPAPLPTPRGPLSPASLMTPPGARGGVGRAGPGRAKLRGRKGRPGFTDASPEALQIFPALPLPYVAPSAPSPPRNGRNAWTQSRAAARGSCSSTSPESYRVAPNLAPPPSPWASYSGGGRVGCAPSPQ